MYKLSTKLAFIRVLGYKNKSIFDVNIMQKERESECNHEIHIDHLEYEINDEQ
jgi:hypothetical protein